MGNCETDCGCNGGCHEEAPKKTINLTLQDDTQLQCDVLGLFEMEGSEYIALLPQGKETALLYKFREVDGQPELSNIETDEEYDKASKVCLELLGINK